MAEPGDPHSPDAPRKTDAPVDAPLDAHAHDDLIGFTSPASLSGRERPPVAESPPETETRAVDDREPEFDFDHLASKATPIGRPAPETVAGTVAEPATPEPSPIPSWAVETPAPPVTRPTRDFARSNGSGGAVDGSMGLYTVYALILFAVPTLGVSAVIALLAIWGRPLPEQPIARSHVLFQKRTLWIAAIAAVLGAILIAVNLGVFVLFIMAVWVILRGAWGVMTLAAGRTIADPQHWLISRSFR